MLRKECFKNLVYSSIALRNQIHEPLTKSASSIPTNKKNVQRSKTNTNTQQAKCLLPVQNLWVGLEVKHGVEKRPFYHHGVHLLRHGGQAHIGRVQKGACHKGLIAENIGREEEQEKITRN